MVHPPVVPATWEAEAEGLIEPWRWRLQWGEIAPLHSNLATEQDSISKKKEREKEKKKEREKEKEGKKERKKENKLNIFILKV